MRHGLYSTYSNRKCRCKPCRAAWTAYCRKRRLQRVVEAEQGLIIIPHGTNGGYNNYLCRCKPCKRAHAEKKATLVNACQ